MAEVGPRWAGATVYWLPAWSVVEVLSGKKRVGKRSWLSGPRSSLSLTGSGFWVGWCPHPGRDRAVKGPGLWGKIEGKPVGNYHAHPSALLDS